MNQKPDSAGINQASPAHFLAHGLGLCLVLLVWLLTMACIPQASPERPTAKTSVWSLQTKPGKAQINSSAVLAEVLMRVQLDYVEPGRLDASKMLEGSLLELGRSHPEIVVEHQTPSQIEVLQLSVEGESLTVKIDQMEHLADLNAVLQRVISFIKSHPSYHSNVKAVEHALVRGMLDTLDPHSRVLSDDIYNEFQINTRGNFGGVGLMVGIREGKLMVISPIDGTPAARAGLKAMDHIVRIDGEDSTNLSLTDTLTKLRGEVGSTVVLHVKRKGVPTPLRFELERAIIKIESVESTDLLDQGQVYRYVKIKNFQENTFEDLSDHLKYMKDVKGIILDLRNNPGGLLDQAIKVADLFLDDEKVIVSTVSNQEQKRVYHSHWNISRHQVSLLPVVVLVNNGSASASEIVAAALKNNQRALILGEQTFGKGSVQMVWELKNRSALKLTIAKYLTPGEHSIQSVGVTPNVLLYPVTVNQSHMHLSQHTENTLEKELSGNFSEWASQGDKPLATLPYLELADPKVMERLDYDRESLFNSLKDDLFVEIAKSALKAASEEQNQNQAFMAQRVYSEFFPQQEQRLIKELAEVGVDWSSGPASNQDSNQDSNQAKVEADVRLEWIPMPLSELEQQMPDQDDLNVDSYLNNLDQWQPAPAVIPADHAIRVYASATNPSQTPLYRVMVTSDSELALFSHLEMPLGKLEPGQSRSWKSVITLPKQLTQSVELLNFQFTDQHQNELATVQHPLRIQALPRPEYKLELSLLDNGEEQSAGNGDTELQQGETITLKLHLTNIGQGTANQPKIQLKRRGGSALEMLEWKTQLADIKPGQSQQTLLRFRLLEHEEFELPELMIDLIDEDFLDANVRITLRPEGPHPLKKLTPPSFDLQVFTADQHNAPAITQVDSITIQGMASDDQHLKDVFIFRNQQKVFYQRNEDQDNTKSMPLNIPLKLEEGHNQISIIARDDQGLTHKRLVQFWYEPKS